MTFRADKAVITAAAIVLCTSTATAGDAIDRFAERVAQSRVTFGYSYRVKGDIPLSGKGNIELQGVCFKMTSNGVEIFSNGSTRWTIDREAAECYIENAATQERLTDPTSFLQSIGSAFIRTAERDSHFGNAGTRAYDLTPVSENSGIAECTVHFNAADIPVGAEITTEDGTTTVFSISGMKFLNMSDSADFNFDTGSLPASYVVTDLR